VSLIEDGSACVTAEAGQFTLLSGPYDRTVSLDQLQQHIFLDHIQSLAFFQGRRSAEQSDNAIANQTRHVIQDLDLADESHSQRTSYAAVPIKSASGQLLGIYSVTDSRIRDDFLDQETYTILTDIASATSRYLESQHIQLEKDHDTQAKLNLSKFLEHNRPQRARNMHATKHLPTHPKITTQPRYGTSSPSNSSDSNSDSQDTLLDETVRSTASTPLTTPTEERSEFSFVNPPPMPTSDQRSVMRESGTSTIPNDRPPHRALSVAADLIRAAHNLEGLVLLDATFGSDHESSQSFHYTTAGQSSKCEKLEVSILRNEHTPARVLSSMSIEHESLGLLISHFPDGCALKTGDKGVLALVVANISRSGPALYEGLDPTIVIPADLQLLLYQATSLIFMPLWDSARQAFYAGILGWAVDPIRDFAEHDLLSLSIYGRILTAEITCLGMYDVIIVRKTLADSRGCRCH
jgi:hypothetical protein